MKTDILSWTWVVIFFAIFGMTGCGSDDGEEEVVIVESFCGPYPEQATSPWVLPYSPGQSFEVTQGNCSNFSHKPLSPAARHAYDFGMPIGTPLIATRDGRVHNLSEAGPNGTGRQEDINFIQIRHGDGSVVEYAHLTTEGALFDIDQFVRQGDTIALSGNSGPSTGPHLHYVVWKQVGDATSIPIVFSNTLPHPNGLSQGVNYFAEKF